MKIKVNKKIFFVLLAITIILAAWGIPTLAENPDTSNYGMSGTALGESAALLFSTRALTEAQKKAYIAQVEAGLLDTAYASWWQLSTDSDDTNAIQSAINSNAKTVIIDNIGRNWIVNPLFIKGVVNKTIVLQKDVVLEAKKGSYADKNDCLFSIINSSNINVQGEGNVTFLMHKADYIGATSLVKPGEWRHGLLIKDSHNITVEGLTIRDTGGDGVAIATSFPPQENISLIDVHTRYAYRNGLTIGSGRNILMKNCSFNNTIGTNPQAGVDIEAHDPGVVFDNVRFEGCEIAENAVGGFVIAYGLFDETSEESYVMVKDTVIRDNIADAAIQIPARYKAGGHLIFEDVTFSSRDNSMYALQVVASQVHVDLNNVNFISKRPDGTGIAILAEQRDYSTQGSVTLNNVHALNNNVAGNIIYWSDRYDQLNKPLTGKKAQPSNYFGEIQVTSTNGRNWSFSATDVFNSLLLNKPAVSSVAFTEKTSYLTPGNIFRFKGKVQGNNAISQRIYWTIEGAVSPNTNIDTRGYLSISPNETAQTIRVIGTPASDATKAIQQIIYVNQAPPVSDTSSGSGSSGGSSSSGGGSPHAGGNSISGSGSNSVTDRPFTLAIGTPLLKKALVEKALDVKTISLSAVNYTSVEASVLSSLQTEAKNAGVELIVHFDQVKDKSIQTRVTVNAKEITAKLKLVNNTVTSNAIKTNFTKFLKNSLEVYTLPANMKLVIKAPLGITKDQLILYSYDKLTNNYHLIKDYTLDKNGYVHFTSPTETIIISDGLLAKK